MVAETGMSGCGGLTLVALMPMEGGRMNCAGFSWLGLDANRF